MTALALLVPVAQAQTVVGGYHYKGKIWAADPLPAQPKVGGHNAGTSPPAPVVHEPAGTRALKPHQVAAPVWPKAGTQTAPVDGTLAAGVKFAATDAAQPVAVPFAPASTPTSVQVRTVDRATAQAAGVDGLMVGVSRQDGSGATGKVSVSLDYGAVAQAYGGGWASRLHLVQLPACAQTTPQLAQCQTQTPLATTNDPVTHQLTAGVALPASGGSAAPRAMSMMAAPMAAAASSTTVAAVAGTDGSQGDYSATSLAASGNWSQTASGAFTYAYPIELPQALGGAEPSVSLSYDSQSVDGETSARNSQSSWIGDGWNYSPGFIERQYKSCATDGIDKSADKCWTGSNATLQLGSHNGQLVRDGSGTYHLLGDDGTKVELLTGASNGLWNGEYFKVTTTDGTQ
ncbi:hypothetical protein ACFW1A_31505, partial [Kitasatospora sp. NPDC058965]